MIGAWTLGVLQVLAVPGLHDGFRPEESHLVPPAGHATLERGRDSGPRVPGASVEPGRWLVLDEERGVV